MHGFIQGLPREGWVFTEYDLILCLIDDSAAHEAFKQWRTDQ